MIDFAADSDSLPLLIIIVGLPALVVLAWLLSAARSARRVVKDQDRADPPAS